jgi:hypothetical protein
MIERMFDWVGEAGWVGAVVQVHPQTAYRWFREDLVRRSLRMALCAQPGDVGGHRDPEWIRPARCSSERRRGARVNAVIQAYRFALAPTPEQDVVLRSRCGGQRYSFNWGLALVTAVMDQRKAEASYGMPAAVLTPSLNWSAYSLWKLWNQAKHTVAPWWAENSKEAYSSGLANLATTLGNWHASKTGTGAGPKIRFPRFKGKRHGMSCRFTTGAFGLAEGDRRHVKLPRIGLVRTHE